MKKHDFDEETTYSGNPNEGRKYSIIDLIKVLIRFGEYDQTLLLSLL
jgi:hypothetical protein